MKENVMDIVNMFREMIFHVLAITFNTKTGFGSYEMTSGQITQWSKINYLDLKEWMSNCWNAKINIVLCWQDTVFERKWNLLALILTPIKTHIRVDRNVNLMAYFIASKCFAAKTEIPNRWLDVRQSGFSKILHFKKINFSF